MLDADDDWLQLHESNDAFPLSIVDGLAESEQLSTGTVTLQEPLPPGPLTFIVYVVDGALGKTVVLPLGTPTVPGVGLIDALVAF